MLQQLRAGAGWTMTLPLIVGISGASGAIYGIRLLEVLQSIRRSPPT